MRLDGHAVGCSLAIWLCVAFLEASNPSTSNAARGYPSLDEGTSPVAILNVRYQLELRRAGGPRPGIVSQLLKERASLEDPSWEFDLVEACKRNLVDCDDYLSLAAKPYGQVPAGTSDHLYGLIRHEAALHDMSPTQRRAIFLRALREQAIVDDPVSLNAWEAAERALNEGMLDLIGDIRKAEADWPIYHWGPIEERHIKIASALAASDASGALLALVRAGVGAHPDEPEEITARVALGELRRLNPPGAEMDLKALMELYLPAKLQHEQETEARAQTLGHPLKLDTLAYLEYLGRQIAETIGDLGDRTFERKTLGGRTLWDQVHEVESRLLKQGKLPASEMVSR